VRRSEAEIPNQWHKYGVREMRPCVADEVKYSVIRRLARVSVIRLEARKHASLNRRYRTHRSSSEAMEARP
jgi:ArsR family metal-binding transcriptional regulator